MCNKGLLLANWIVCFAVTCGVTGIAEEAPPADREEKAASEERPADARPPAEKTGDRVGADEKPPESVPEEVRAETGGDTPVKTGGAAEGEATAGDTRGSVSSAETSSEVASPAPRAKVELTSAEVHPVSEAPAVGETGSDSEKTADDDETRILTGTWTKSILFSTKNGTFRFQPRGWIQPRFRVAINGNEDYNNDEALTGTAFSLKRARFGFQAWIFNWARMYLDTGWNGRGGQVIDYFVDMGPQNGGGAIAVRLGFFRPYFIRQLLHATTKLAMIEYAAAWTDPALGLGIGPSGRQLGLGIQGFVANGFEYGIGIWNGADSFSIADSGNADFMGGGRIALHPLGLAGVGNAVRPGDESDTAISSAPGLSIGAAAYVEDRDDAEQTLPPLGPYDDRQFKLGIDLAFQYAGVSLEGELFVTKAWAEDQQVADMLASAYLDAPGIGTYFQAGYMFNQRFELVGRFDMVDENTEIRGIRFYPTIGGTVFIYGNNLKVQAQYRVNIGAGYEDGDIPGDPYMPITHDLFFMVQASI